MNKMNFKITYNVKELRTEKGITLKELSRRSGVSTTHINDIENQKNHPTIYTMYLLSAALEVYFMDLFTISDISDNK